MDGCRRRPFFCVQLSSPRLRSLAPSSFHLYLNFHHASSSFQDYSQGFRAPFPSCCPSSSPKRPLQVRWYLYHLTFHSLTRDRATKAKKPSPKIVKKEEVADEIFAYVCMRLPVFCLLIMFNSAKDGGRGSLSYDSAKYVPVAQLVYSV